MTVEELSSLAKGLAQEFRPIITALEARLAVLEARPELRYMGVWKPGSLYSYGGLVTCEGSLWHANKQTEARPGESTDWVLVAKRGADGRDAKERRQ